MGLQTFRGVASSNQGIDFAMFMLFNNMVSRSSVIVLWKSITEHWMKYINTITLRYVLTCIAIRSAYAESVTMTLCSVA